MTKKRNASPIKPIKIPLSKLFPNFVTILALCLGISAVRYALDDKMQIAAGLIVIAGFMDGLDGRIARYLNSASKFGAQLDSFTDMVSFGVAPAFVMYLWSLNHIPYKGVGWAVVLIYITCSALRLARYNVQSEDKQGAIKGQYFFTGIPMPCAAGLVLLPLMMTFELTNIQISPWLVASYIILIGILMISRFPTYSFKKTNISPEYSSILLIVGAIIIVTLILEPWIVLPVFGLIYWAMIPFSIISYQKFLKQTHE